MLFVYILNHSLSMTRSLLLLLFIFFLSPSLFAQDVDLLNQAKEEMKAEDYKAANLTFRQILSSGKKIQPEVTYLFSETLFMVGQYHNSNGFLQKYLELTGKGGDYYKESLQLQSFLGEKMLQIKSCDFCDFSGYRFEPCVHCESTGVRKEICNVCRGNIHLRCQSCQGEGVIITADELGAKYYEGCTRCEGNGYTTCFKCQGLKTIEEMCRFCNGTSHLRSEELCEHPEADKKLDQN